MILTRYSGLAAILSLLPTALAHSWIDNISNGENIGYIRGYAGHIDADETWKILQNPPGIGLCMNTPTDQTDPTNYSQQYPRLVVKAGDNIVANYTENGHVTQDKLAPDNKPHPGQYKWYWTGIPFQGSTTDGSQIALFSDLDDKFLLSGPSNFDDGRCAESDNNSMGRTGPTNCQSHLTIPAGTKPGIYSLYWVWNFPKVPPSIDPTYSEVYTSCMDVEVVAGDSSANATASDNAATGADTAATAAVDTAATPTGAVADTNNEFTTTITRTRRHTRFEKVFKTVTESITRTAGDKFIYATNAANLDVKVIRTERWITVYQTL